MDTARNRRELKTPDEEGIPGGRTSPGDDDGFGLNILEEDSAAATTRRPPETEEFDPVDAHDGDSSGDDAPPTGEDDGDDDEGPSRLMIAVAVVALLLVGYAGYLALSPALGWLFGADDPAAAEEAAAPPRQEAPAVSPAVSESGSESGSEASRKTSEAAGEKGEAAKSAPPDAGEAEDTGITVKASEVDSEGSVSVEIEGGKGWTGKGTWTGAYEKEDDGEAVDLKGPTFGRYQSGFDTPSGSITFGNFGTVTDDNLVVHGSYHRRTPDEGGGKEIAEGTYYAEYEDGDGEVEKNEGLLSWGSYTDVRGVGEKEIVRTYTDHDGKTNEVLERYSKRFEAQPGVPVPTLVGWNEPSVD